MAERIRLTGKNDGVNDNEAIDAQVDSTYNAVHVKSHLYGHDGIGFTNPITANAGGQISVLAGLEIPAHNYVAMSYTGDDLTGVDYKTGGSSGTVVATLVLTYTANVLQTVTRTV